MYCIRPDTLRRIFHYPSRPPLIRNVTRVHVRRMCDGWPSDRGARGSRIESEVWRTERGLQVVEESVVFSTIEVVDKHAGPSDLGDLEVTEYIARIHRGPLEREDGASVHLATTEAPDKKSSSLFYCTSDLLTVFITANQVPLHVHSVLLLLTIGAHAQRGLQYLVCVSVCLSVCVYDYSRTTGY